MQVNSQCKAQSFGIFESCYSYVDNFQEFDNVLCSWKTEDCFISQSKYFDFPILLNPF